MMNYLINFIEAGYPPYRTNIFTMQKLAKGSTGFWDVTRSIKDAWTQMVLLRQDDINRLTLANRQFR